MRSFLALGLALLAAARVAPRQEDAYAETQLLIGGGPSGTIAVATFDDIAGFSIIANDTRPGTSASWLLFKPPNLVYAVDENSNSTRLFTVDAAAAELTLVQNATGSSGVVFLEFDLTGSFIVGPAFGQGQIDVWNVSAADGTLSLFKQIPSDDALGPNTARQDAPHPHQALLDNSGRWFAVNDLGTDTILVIDSADDSFDVVNHVRVPLAGCGPRHGAFYPRTGADFATTYVVVCEMLSTLIVFSLDYPADGNITFTPIQTISTFGDAFPPANLSSATAGEIAISDDNTHVYVSNRNTGNETDSISVFSITGGQSSSGNITLAFSESISSGGKVPRMFSLSIDEVQAKVFVANQDGDLALLAMNRAEEDGSLVAADTAATVPLSTFGAAGFGPQFVQQVNLTAA